MSVNTQKSLFQRVSKISTNKGVDGPINPLDSTMNYAYDAIYS